MTKIIKAGYKRLAYPRQVQDALPGTAMRKLVHLCFGVLICTNKYQLVTKLSIQLIHEPLQFFRQRRTQLHSLSSQRVGEGNAVRMQKHAL